MDKPTMMSFSLFSLSSVANTRVAYNGVGEGRSDLAWPSPLRLTAVAPQIPEAVAVTTIQSATSLQVSWIRPSFIGGADLESFVIEYDTSPAFATRNGLPLGHLTLSESDADASIGLVSMSYPDSSDPILRKRIVISEEDVISQGVIGVGSVVVIEGQHLTVSSINEDSCGVTCLNMDQDYTGTNVSGMKVYSGLVSYHHYHHTLTGLIPGTAFFVRVAAVNVYARSPFAFPGYPFSPVSSTPMDIPTGLSWASLSAVSKDKMRIDYGPPSPLGKPYGIRGSPPSRYRVEVATGSDAIQELQVTSTTTEAIGHGTFALTLEGEDTACIAIGASAETVEMALESLSTIDDISVTLSAPSSTQLKYNIIFDGPQLANKNQPLLQLQNPVVCTPLLDVGTEIQISSIKDGVDMFVPESLSVSTKADTEVSGFFELSVGFQGNHDMIVSVGNQPAQFMAGPGSRWVDTAGDDLTSILHPGESIVIGDELTKVLTVSADKIELEEYHIRGTNGVAVPGYRMNNYIGSATISNGDNILSVDNAHDLQTLVRLGEVIEVTSDVGREYLTVTGVTTNSLTVSPSFTGSTTKTPIHVKKKVIVPANSSSAAMKASLESLKDVGSVKVTREGPNSAEGFTWELTFTSNMGMPSCSLPSWCFTSSTETVAYYSVSGFGDEQDGNYVQTSYHDGRPKYVLLGKACHIAYATAFSEWRLYKNGSVTSSVPSSDVSIPLSGWSNGATIAPSSSTTALLIGDNAAAQVSVIQTGVQQSFENIVFSTDVEVGQHEVQEVELLSDKDDLDGSFELSLGSISQKITIYADESNDDFSTKLQSLSGIGRVSVDSTQHSDKFGLVWIITFINYFEDVPLLRHYGTFNLQGTGVSLIIQERVKGSSGQQHVDFHGEEGGTYASRIYAENEAGIGPYTTASQALGGGLQPLSRSLSSPPGPPSLSVGTVTRSRADVAFSYARENGSDILSYKFEWTTSPTFGVMAQINAAIACSDGSEVLGHYSYTYGNRDLSRSATSAPIDIRSSSADIALALNTFELLNQIEVSTETEEPSELEWTITFLYDVGPIGDLSINAEDLRCQSEEPVVETAITMAQIGSIQADYGSREIFANEILCGSVNLGEFSAVQHLSLFARSQAVTGGAYQLLLDGKSSECISFDASESEMRVAVEGIDTVEGVDIVATPAPIKSQFPYEYKIVFKGNYAYGDWPALQVNPLNFGSGECDPFIGGTGHRAAILPIRDESLCLDGADITVAIVVESLTSVGGTFTISYGYSSAEASFGTSASEMKNILLQLISPNVHVTRHDHSDVAVGVVWAVSYPRTTNKDDQLQVDGTFLTGRNAKVNVYPILTIKTFSPENDSSGDFRLVINGESTAPLSHEASQNKILQEIHRLHGIGKVNMLGPLEGDEVSFLEFNALLDDTFVAEGLKAIALVGDLTSTFAKGDRLKVGTCELEVKSIYHENYDASQSAGYLYESLYATSLETASARKLGYSIIITSKTGIENFGLDCSLGDGVSQAVELGSVLRASGGTDHSMIIKSYTADLDTIQVTPETNWRGTAPRIFFNPPSGLYSRTFTMTGIEDKAKMIIRASARNNQGFGPFSNAVAIVPSSTVPDMVRNLSLF